MCQPQECFFFLSSPIRVTVSNQVNTNYVSNKWLIYVRTKKVVSVRLKSGINVFALSPGLADIRAVPTTTTNTCWLCFYAGILAANCLSVSVIYVSSVSRAAVKIKLDRPENTFEICYSRMQFVRIVMYLVVDFKQKTRIEKQTAGPLIWWGALVKKTVVIS